MPGFLSPYRRDMYHLKDFRTGGRPRSPQELFNHRHSSLRNMIERCFGVLNARFPILKQMPRYPLKTQKYIGLACCVLHNFIRKNAPWDQLFAEYEDKMIFEGHNENATNRIQYDVTSTQRRHMDSKRVKIANHMWEDYRVEHNMPSMVVDEI